MEPLGIISMKYIFKKIIIIKRKPPAKGNWQHPSVVWDLQYQKSSTPLKLDTRPITGA